MGGIVVPFTIYCLIFRKGEIGMKDLINEGKTKKIFQWEKDPNLVRVQYKNAITAHDNPAKTREFYKKGECSNQTTCRIFELLKKAGIPVAYERQLSDTEFLAKKCTMIPLEVVGRRYTVGSYLKRNPQLAKGNDEMPHRFHKLKIEFFLKTTKGKLINWQNKEIISGLDPLKKEEDPLIANPQSEEWQLYHSKNPAWNKSADLKRSVIRYQVLPGFGFISGEELMGKMETMLLKTFLVIEGAWNVLGLRLIDIKLEFGIDNNGNICVSDVIDNDSWRLRTFEWRELSKENFRQGKNLEDVAEDYELVASLVNQFRIPAQAIVLWKGSKSDDFLDLLTQLGKNELRKIFNIEEIILSAHKSPQKCINRVEELLSVYPEGGVIIAKAGMSNGLGPFLAARTSWPVISVSPTSDSFPPDLWSSFRMPTYVPNALINSDKNAWLYVLNILAQKNPIAYMHRQEIIEGFDE